MNVSLKRRPFLGGIGAATLAAAATPAAAQAGLTLRMSTPATPTDQRSVALAEIFGPAVKDFATYQPHYNSTLFKQGTELEAIARGNLEMSITSAQELATIFPQWSIFTAGYLLRDADHQKKVFASPIMDELKKPVEDRLGVKLLSVMYLGRRQLNLRTEKEIRRPADLAGTKLRMPNTEAWLFLGSALGANPLPLAFTEIYTALQTGVVDAIEVPADFITTQKVFEVSKHATRTHHIFTEVSMFASARKMAALSADHQKVIREAARRAVAEEMWAQNLKEQTAAWAELAGKVKAIPDPDVPSFREKMAPVIANFVSKTGAKGKAFVDAVAAAG